MIKKIKYVYRAYRFRYLIDPNEIDYIIQNLNKGDIAVDIGSHKGGYLYWLKKRVGKKGSVFAFEPQIQLYNYLQDISKTYGYKNIIIENKGLSFEEGKVNFFIPKTKKGDSPGARIGYLDNGTEYNEAEIEITTLDKYFLESKILPALIKIDVEGHEKQVLLGGMNLLKACMPKILIECENRHLNGNNIFDVFKLLLDIGYHGYFFKDKRLKPLSEFNIEIDQKIGEGRFWEANGYINNFIFESNK